MLRHILIQIYIIFLVNFSATVYSLPDGEESPSKEIVLQSFAMPVNDGPLSDLNLVVDVAAFSPCQTDECAVICSSKNPKLAYCDTKNTKLCMCTVDNFYASDLEGTVGPVDRMNLSHKNCSVACNKRGSYARILTKTDKTLQCICLMHQLTKTGITLCDEFAVVDVCKAICQSDLGLCSFNGVCLCRKNWESVFSLQLPNIRKESQQDTQECSSRCSSYHHDYVPRIYDSKMHDGNKTYRFREKYCVCGDELDLLSQPLTRTFVSQGFQICTGLKCKRRCGMDEAVCEPVFKRGCLCKRENIVIGKHLWSRLPGKGELSCQQTCFTHGLDARVIEWNPFMEAEDQKYDPSYRKSAFQYLYDGKFCHCVQVQMDMHQYRPCTDELCKVICGHYEAECDKRTRRACICNTHKMTHGVGRLADPGEINCDIACRYGLFDARILDLKWEVPPDKWGVKISKYCICIRPVSPSGLTHCDPVLDTCPLYCSKPTAYCTREKYCHCGVVHNILKNPMIRLGNGKEQDECGEKCRSWMWPIAEDLDNMPYIYDESLRDCEADSSCPKIDTSPWRPSAPGLVPLAKDAFEELGLVGERNFCLCAKSKLTMYKPGSRFLMNMEPERISKTLPCVTNHTCAIVGSGVHVVSTNKEE